MSEVLRDEQVKVFLGNGKKVLQSNPLLEGEPVYQASVLLSV